ncbi:MAG: hypothetical protein ACR2LP_01970 [Candidatus Limnocylindrales bacterium]
MDIAPDQAPGPSFIREETVLLRGAAPGGGSSVRLGMSRPSIMDDGWWLTTMWATGPAGAPELIEALSIAPVDGPPPEPPLVVMGPIFAGALAGLLDQEDGRQLIRLRMPAAPDEARPWRRPLILWLAVRWDPVRSAVMRPDELARELLRAFARGVEAAGRPG